MLQQPFGIYEKQIVYLRPLKHSSNVFFLHKSLDKDFLAFFVTGWFSFFWKEDFPFGQKKAQTIYEEIFQVITDAYIIIVNSEKSFEKKSMNAVKTFLVMTL